MNYPEKLKIGDTIGICAPSDGISDELKIQKLEVAIKNLKDMGYKILETKSVRKSYKGRSTTGKQRAEEFMKLYENEDVKLIIYAGGGDFLVEMLDYIDWDKLRTLPPKWTQGYSDITGISFLLNTILEVPSIYCDAIKSYAMKPLYRNLSDCLKIELGEEIIQQSFEKYEKEEHSNKLDYSYNLTEKVEWKNLNINGKVQIQGRALGGCFDVIQELWGTKYDKIKEYIQKYKNDGIIWFLECFEMTSAEVYRKLWQMKNSGYFENCTGIIFGRPLFVREDYEIGFCEAVMDAIGKLNIPIIADADIGHVAPQLAIVNGAMLKITSENGKGKIETYLK